MFETLHIRKGLKHYMSEKVGHIFGSYLMPLMGCDFSKIILYTEPENSGEEEWLEMIVAVRLRPGGVVIRQESDMWANTRTVRKTDIPRLTKSRSYNAFKG